MRGHHLLPPKHVDAYRTQSDLHVTAEQQVRALAQASRQPRPDLGQELLENQSV